jgi:uncharacterized SAM-binding protein YcdF (DUF218 family)
MLEQATTLWNWLEIKDNPEVCDVIFLFGGAIIDIAAKGLELYKQDLSRRIITTGNTGTFGNPDWYEPIADVFAAYLIAHGVPEAAITRQNQSMNTLEDVTMTLPVLEANHISHGSIALVSRPLHQRRAYATYQRQDPDARIINLPCSEPAPADLTEVELTDISVRCTQEYERLVQYAAKGELMPQPIPDEVKLAYASLKAMTPGTPL